MWIALLPSRRAQLTLLGVGGIAASLLILRRRLRRRPVVRVPYDEFSMFHENAKEHGLPFDHPPTVRRERVRMPDGRSLSALVWGEGPPEMVLLHGGAQNAHTWDTVALGLGGRPLLCVDLPGHGHSDNSARGVSDPAAAAADLAVLIEALAPAASAVVGMSFGGLTAIELGAQRPELARRLVLVDITPGVTRSKAKHVVDFVNGPRAFSSFDEMLARTIRYNPTRSESSLRRGILHNALQLEDGSWVWRHARFRGKGHAAQQPVEYSRLWDKLGGTKAPVMLVRGMRPTSVVDGALLWGASVFARAPPPARPHPPGLRLPPPDSTRSPCASRLPRRRYRRGGASATAAIHPDRTDSRGGS